LKDLNNVAGVGFYARNAKLTKAEKAENARRGLTSNTDPFNILFEEPRIREEAKDPLVGVSDNMFTETLNVRQSKMITSIAYAPDQMLMKVEFVNHGDVVIYDHLPATVFAQLRIMHESGRSLGASFWDLVRIYNRGNFKRTGSKYNYTYEIKGDSSAGTKPRQGEYNSDYFDPFQGKDVHDKASKLGVKANRAVNESFGSGLLRSGWPDDFVDEHNQKRKGFGPAAGPAGREGRPAGFKMGAQASRMAQEKTLDRASRAAEPRKTGSVSVSARQAKNMTYGDLASGVSGTKVTNTQIRRLLKGDK
jgi:hypothetical protein